MIKELSLSEEQKGRMVTLAKLIEGVGCARFNGYPDEFDEYYVDLYTEKGEWISGLHYYELCFRYIVNAVAEQFANTHLTATTSFTGRAIYDKLMAEVDSIHPVDLLYDIWKHPKKYAQDL